MHTTQQHAYIKLEEKYGPINDPDTVIELSHYMNKEKLISSTSMIAEQGSEWNIKNNRTIHIYIGPSHDFVINGTISIDGDAIMTTKESGILVRGTLSVSGTCRIQSPFEIAECELPNIIIWFCHPNKSYNIIIA